MHSREPRLYEIASARRLHQAAECVSGRGPLNTKTFFPQDDLNKMPGCYKDGLCTSAVSNNAIITLLNAVVVLWGCGWLRIEIVDLEQPSRDNVRVQSFGNRKTLAVW